MATKKKTGSKKTATPKKKTAAKKKTTSASKKTDLITQLARAEKQLMVSRTQVAGLRRTISAKPGSAYTITDPH